MDRYITVRFHCAERALAKGCEVNDEYMDRYITVRFYCVGGGGVAEGCEVDDGRYDSAVPLFRAGISRRVWSQGLYMDSYISVRLGCPGRGLAEGCEVKGGTWTAISAYGLAVQGGD